MALIVQASRRSARSRCCDRIGCRGLHLALGTLRLQSLISTDHLPLYLHCLDGGAATGTVIMVLRKLQNWTISAITTEFCRPPPLCPDALALALAPESHTRARRVGTAVLGNTLANRFTGDRISHEELQFCEVFKEEIELPSSIPEWLWGYSCVLECRPRRAATHLPRGMRVALGIVPKLWFAQSRSGLSISKHPTMRVKLPAPSSQPESGSITKMVSIPFQPPLGFPLAAALRRALGPHVRWPNIAAAVAAQDDLARHGEHLLKRSELSLGLGLLGDSVPEDCASVTSVDSDSNSRHEAAHIAPASFADLTRVPSNNAHKLAVLSYEGNFSSRVSPPPRARQLRRVRTRYRISAHAP